MKYESIREEELKNKVAQDFFKKFDCTKIVGNVDFCVTLQRTQDEVFEQQSLLWAEAKTGASDVFKSISQLILTIGKARTFDSFLPPPLLGAFDGEKIAFIPYSEILDIFQLNDFNWNITPSNYGTKEFKIVCDRVKATIEKDTLLFDFVDDENTLKLFIKTNFLESKIGLSKVRIDKNNFIAVYNRWVSQVKKSIAVDWDKVKEIGIIDGDFYLADLLSENNHSIKEDLSILLQDDRYRYVNRSIDAGFFNESTVDFLDKQVAHSQFWNRYERPPKEEYWDYIIHRRDLLVPQDIRERKGSFFTPQIWVELSQTYLADVLGESWQDEYYIWDCAAGTGNLLAGLTNKYNIWASTLDQQDVDVMKDRIKNGANLLEQHTFQFDFLNDAFDLDSDESKLPKSLRDIIKDSEKRKKLVVYINPPYAEADNRRGEGRTNVAESMIHKKYADKMGYGKREMYIQFLTRVYLEIGGCVIADFSTLKNLQAPRFSTFRKLFKSKLESIFIVPAKTFDNVSGEVPIGFKVWDTFVKEEFMSKVADVYNESGKLIDFKRI